jgi:hypothetical protein
VNENFLALVESKPVV